MASPELLPHNKDQKSFSVSIWCDPGLIVLESEVGINSNHVVVATGVLKIANSRLIDNG